jgi:TRAP transporter TAXI family solute receptor
VSTDGALSNLEMVAAGKLESGLVQGDVAYWAHVGRGPFEGRGKVGGLSTIAALNPETVHLVVRRTLKVKRIAQLAGRRISIGTERSATPLAARAILQAYGVSLDRSKISQETPARAAELMQKGQLDAFFVVAGQPVPVIADLAERMEIDILPIKGKQAEGLILNLPFLTRGQIEAGQYKGAGGVPTLATPAQWIVSSKADPELVYGITKALWHNNMRQLLDTRHPDGKRIRRETAMQGIFVPLHPGAARYYRETGVLN